METFHWDKTFETGLKTVDDQHHDLVTLINHFSTSIKENAEPASEELERIYQELAGYAQYHFAEEQSLMKQVGMDPRHLKAHLQQHAAFLADVTRNRQEAGERFAAGARPLLNFLIHWLAYHILGMDQAMARQIAAIRDGASPAIAFVATRMGEDAACSPLLKSLNGLFEIVSERNRQLFEMNRSLEVKVSERTQDLAETNQTLVQTIERLKAEQEQTLRLSQELTSANIRLETLAMTDLLTGLFNRRYALDRLASELAAAKRYGDPLSLVLVDADGFKAVNDTYGHDAGDAVIQTLGSALKQLFRANDVVCRMGGDEFLILCPRSPLDAAYQVAERVRAAVSAMKISTGAGEWKGSLSAGIAALGPHRDNAEALIKAADLAVYKAKHQGRNRVVADRESDG